MTGEDIKWFSTLGVGGVLACMIFFYYRWDFLRERAKAKDDKEQHTQREDRILTVLEATARSNEALAQALRDLSTTIRDAERSRADQFALALNQLMGIKPK